MTIILASILKAYERDEQENYIPIKLEDDNQILTNIKKYTNGNSKFVMVANNPEDYEKNDARFAATCKCFEITNIKFEQNIMLDDRNSQNAKEILQGANLIVLCGGKCLVQNKFFEKIKLKEFLQDYKNLVIGISAGSMNLCNTVANFPEELADIDEPRWLNGLGFCDKIIIPHFDQNGYQFDCPEVDIVNDYIFPMSTDKEFYGIDNDSYFLINNKKEIKLFGNCYKIFNKKIKKIK